jgi:hypothetical protein
MGLREKGRILLVLFAATLLLASSAGSQTIEKGEISGTIMDQTGAVMPDASVKIINVATGAERTLTTSSDGRYAANLLPVGEYRIEVFVKGFATTVVKGVRLAVGQNLIQDISLKLAAVGQTVEVQAEAGPVDRGETRENTVIDRTYIERLPINGRDFRDFANLTPTADTAPGLRSPVRLGGQQGEYTELIIDGVDNRESFFGEWFGSLETKNFTFPQDAVQEFQVRRRLFGRVRPFHRRSGQRRNQVGHQRMARHRPLVLPELKPSQEHFRARSSHCGHSPGLQYTAPVWRHGGRTYHEGQGVLLYWR